MLSILLPLWSMECELEIHYSHQHNHPILKLHYPKGCKLNISDKNNTVTIKFISTTKQNNIANIKHTKKQSVSKVEKLLSIAKDKLGSSYKPGAKGPKYFDCSGFVYYVFGQVGYSIPRVSTNQAKIGKKLTKKELKKGDIVCFDTSKKGHVNHTGIYLGQGKFIHASSGKAYSVTISDLTIGFYKDKFQWGIRILDK